MKRPVQTHQLQEQSERGNWGVVGIDAGGHDFREASLPSHSMTFVAYFGSLFKNHIRILFPKKEHAAVDCLVILTLSM